MQAKELLLFGGLAQDVFIEMLRGGQKDRATQELCRRVCAGPLGADPAGNCALELLLRDDGLFPPGGGGGYCPRAGGGGGGRAGAAAKPAGGVCGPSLAGG